MNDVLKRRHQSQVDSSYGMILPPFQDLQMSLTGPNQNQLPGTFWQGQSSMGRSVWATFVSFFSRLPAGRLGIWSIGTGDVLFHELSRIQIDIDKGDLVQIPVK